MLTKYLEKAFGQIDEENNIENSYNIVTNRFNDNMCCKHYEIIFVNLDVENSIEKIA